MNRQRKEWLSDNKGSTLIEIIISVLIVGLAFVPLLMGMSTAMKANKKSESMLFADNVSSKVAEVLKAAKGPDDAVALLGSEASKSGAGKISISSITEGDRTYTVDINYTSSGTLLDALNKAEDYRSVAAMEGTRKALYIDTSVDYAALKMIESKRNSTFHKEGLDLIEFIKNKKTSIVITKMPATDDDYPNMIKVAYEVEYELDNSGSTDRFTVSSVKKEMLPQYYNTLPDGLLLFTSSLKNVSSVNKDGTSGISQALYDYYLEKETSASTIASYKAATNLRESIVIDNEVTNLADLKVYCFVAGADITRAYNNADASESPDDAYDSIMNFSVTNKSTIGDSLSIFCPLQISGTGSFNMIGSLLEKAGTDDISKIYEVGINVKDSVTGAVESSLDTTIIWN